MSRKGARRARSQFGLKNQKEVKKIARRVLRERERDKKRNESLLESILEVDWQYTADDGAEAPEYESD